MSTRKSIQTLSERSIRRNRKKLVDSLLQKYKKLSTKQLTKEVTQCNIETEGNGDVEVQDCDSNFNYNPNLLEIDPEKSALSCTEDNVESTQTNSIDYLNELREWSLKYNISRTALTDLLKILKTHECFKSFPADGRTIFKSSNFEIQPLGTGKFVYCGIVEKIVNFVKLSPNQIQSVELDINIDGLPLFKSSSTQLWPILAHIVGSSFVFLIGAFCGEHKPNDLNEFLNSFVDEISGLVETGIRINSETINISLRAFICDAPARALVCGIKNHTGYHGCGKCQVKGKYVENRVVFLKTTAPLRNDNSFRQKEYPKHHIYDSPLLKLNIDIISSFPFEYMHLVCLGVVRKILKLWIEGPRSSYRLSSKLTAGISEKLVLCRENFVTDIARKPRSLKELDRWKATEFRSFLLYTGPAVCRKIVSPNIYEHFLVLSVAIRILCDKHSTQELLNYAEELLVYFVEQFKVLYHRKFVSYNVHGLVHLTADAKHLGSLDNFSAFVFENYLGKLKKLIRNAKEPLKQLIAKSAAKEEICLQQLREAGTPIKNNPSCSSGSIFINDTKITSKFPNNIILLQTRQIAKVQAISVSSTGKVSLDIETFSKKSLFKSPCDSSLVDIYKINLEKSLSVTKIDIALVRQKCVCVKLKGAKFGIFPLIHGSTK